jgi:hypothetical protein
MRQTAQWRTRQTVGGQEYGDNMADAHTRIDNLKVDIRGLGDSILDLQATVDAHGSKLEQIMASLTAHSARFDAHDARFDALDKRLAGHGARLNGLEARFDGLETRFDGLGTRFDGLETRYDARFDNVDVKLAEILSRLPQRPQ